MCPPDIATARAAPRRTEATATARNNTSEAYVGGCGRGLRLDARVSSRHAALSEYRIVRATTPFPANPMDTNTGLGCSDSVTLSVSTL